MKLNGLERFAPLAGVLAVAFWIAAVISDGMSNPPDDKAPATEFAAYLHDHDVRIYVSATMFGVGVAAFIWFVGTLAARLRAAEDDSRLSSISLASGVATVVLLLCASVPNVAGAMAGSNLGRELSPEAAETLWVLGGGFFVAAEFVAVAFMASTALSILRSGVFPRWVGWVTTLMAVVLIIVPIGWAVLIFAIPVWTVLLAVWLYVREMRDAEPSDVIS